MTKVKIKELFVDLQEEMLCSLRINKKNIPHEGKKGEATENRWKKWLTEYLPKRYSVDSAFVIDHEGNCSEQIDLVIFDRQYTPFVFNKDGQIFIPAESVYAVFDVKQELSKSTLKATSKKILSVRSLIRTTSPIPDARGHIHVPKKPYEIVGGILATYSKWNPVFGKPFHSTMSAFSGNGKIDIGCIINDGAFIVSEDDKGKLKIQLSNKEEILITFFLNLFLTLQKLGTAPAMDVLKYAQALKSI